MARCKQASDQLHSVRALALSWVERGRPLLTIPVNRNPDADECLELNSSGVTVRSEEREVEPLGAVAVATLTEGLCGRMRSATRRDASAEAPNSVALDTNLGSRMNRFQPRNSRLNRHGLSRVWTAGGRALLIGATPGPTTNQWTPRRRSMRKRVGDRRLLLRSLARLRGLRGLRSAASSRASRAERLPTCSRSQLRRGSSLRETCQLK